MKAFLWSFTFSIRAMDSLLSTLASGLGGKNVSVGLTVGPNGRSLFGGTATLRLNIGNPAAVKPNPTPQPREKELYRLTLTDPIAELAKNANISSIDLSKLQKWTTLLVRVRGDAPMPALRLPETLKELVFPNSADADRVQIENLPTHTRVFRGFHRVHALRGSGGSGESCRAWEGAPALYAVLGPGGTPHFNLQNYTQAKLIAFVASHDCVDGSRVRAPADGGSMSSVSAEELSQLVLPCDALETICVVADPRIIFPSRVVRGGRSALHLGSRRAPAPQLGSAFELMLGARWAHLALSQSEEAEVHTFEGTALRVLTYDGETAGMGAEGNAGVELTLPGAPFEAVIASSVPLPASHVLDSDSVRFLALRLSTRHLASPVTVRAPRAEELMLQMDLQDMLDPIHETNPQLSKVENERLGAERHKRALDAFCAAVRNLLTDPRNDLRAIRRLHLGGIADLFTCFLNRPAYANSSVPALLDALRGTAVEEVHFESREHSRTLKHDTIRVFRQNLDDLDPRSSVSASFYSKVRRIYAASA